jgi:guanine nucleotide-binding protein G(I)/G(S)/G(T) subunit beta-1
MDLPLPTAARAAGSSGRGSQQALSPRIANVSLRRALAGHFGKLYDLSWGSDSTTLLTAAQDGKIIIWNALRKLKRRVFSLDSKWTLCCDLAPSMAVCAAGGLDNTVSIFPTNLNTDGPAADAKPTLLREHEGYLSSMTFISDNKLVTSSGDTSIIVWDVSKGLSTVRLKGHESDVMAVAPCPVAPDVLASGSCDTSMRVWDVRFSSSESVVSFQRHESDVNRVKWVPDSQYAVLTGSDDNTCRLHDIRTSKSELAVYSDESRVINPVTCVDFSRSGKLLFVGYDDGVVRVWDTVTCTIQTDFLAAEKRVTALEVSPDGFALATADWEGLIHLWA